MRVRWGYAGLAAAVLVVEIGIALFVRDRVVRPYGGDVLAVIGVYLAVRAVTGWRVDSCVTLALGVALLIELGQLGGLTARLGLADGSAAAVALGRGFDPLDLLAYMLGGLVVLAVERMRS